MELFDRATDAMGPTLKRLIIRFEEIATPGVNNNCMRLALARLCSLEELRLEWVCDRVTASRAAAFTKVRGTAS
jgi:hypothetical protein